MCIYIHLYESMGECVLVCISYIPTHVWVHRWVGTAFGGWKSRSDVPKLVERVLDGSLEIDHYITHTFKGVENTNDAFDALHSGSCLRAVVIY